MATQAAVSGNSVKNDGGSLLHAGSIASSRWANITLATTTDNSESYGSKVFEAVSPVSSGNVGTFRPLNAGVFGKMEVGQFVAKVLGTRIAQTDNTFLRSGAAETASRTSLHYARGNRRYDITDWSYTTGAATKGGNEGNLFTYVDPVGGAAQAHEPFPTDAVPGELVYLVSGKTPDQDNYKARTNP
jgi:hypothetical protein